MSLSLAAQKDMDEAEKKGLIVPEMCLLSNGIWDMYFRISLYSHT